MKLFPLSGSPGCRGSLDTPYFITFADMKDNMTAVIPFLPLGR